LTEEFDVNQLKQRCKAHFAHILVAGLILFAAEGAMANNRYSNVSINGQVLTVQQLNVLQMQLGTTVAPGRYLLDQQGCWANLTTGATGCIGSVNTYSRNGSGERTSDGSWSHYSNPAGTGVGGTADGCIYTTTGWSNC
jgi:hypothetical protein